MKEFKHITKPITKLVENISTGEIIEHSKPKDEVKSSMLKGHLHHSIKDNEKHYEHGDNEFMDDYSTRMKRKGIIESTKAVLSKRAQCH